MSIKQNDWHTFFEAPSTNVFQKLQRRAWGESQFQSPGVLLTSLPELFAQEAFFELLKAADALPAFLQLSPRFHFLCGVACEELGKRGLSNYHRRAVQTLLSELLGSGDGTRLHPYRPTFTTDQYDLIRSLQGEIRHQQLVRHKHNLFDVITCHDGEDFWFDVTRMIAANEQAARLTESARG